MEPNKLPVPHQLALSFSKQWEDFGNTSSPALVELWTIIFQTFNDCIERNVSGSEREYSVIPAVTGSGKTLCYQWYAAELAKQSLNESESQQGMLIVTSLTREADEAVNNIDKWAGSEVAVAYHSDSSIKKMHDESCLNSFQIVVITHEYFKRHHHLKSLRSSTYQKVINFNDKERELVVIDESIEMVNNICITQEDIKLVEVNLGTLLSRGYDQLYNEHRLLQYLDNNYKTLFIDTSTLDVKQAFIHLNNNNDLVKSISIDLKLTREKVIGLFSFKHSIELLEGEDLLNVNRALRREGKDEIVRAANDFQYLLDNHLYLYQDKEYRVSTMELPLKSVVILHATALIDTVCQIVPHVKVINELPRVKRYSNVTVEFFKTDHALGKGLTSDLVLNEHYMTDLVSTIDFFEDRKGVLFTHLDLEKQHPSLKNFCQVNHFNNLNGINDYNECTDVFIYGHMYLPDYIFYDLQYHSNDGSTVEQRKTNIKVLKYSRIASDVVQMINRGICRGIVNGEAPEMRVSILMPINRHLVKVIKDAINQEMPRVNTVESQISFEFRSDDKGYQLSDLDFKFLEALKSCMDGQRFASLCSDVGITKSGRETLMVHLRDSNSPLSKASSFELRKDGQYKVFKKA